MARDTPAARATGATPAWSVTPVDGVLGYAEGPFVGYRGHLAGRAPEPEFWFGHGLGYTTWRLDDARLTGPGDRPHVAVTVTTTGPRPGRDVVQVYLRPAESDQPVRLAGWAGVDLVPGESREVTVPTDARMWRRWDTTAARWDTLAPGGELLVGHSAADIHATLALPVEVPSAGPPA